MKRKIKERITSAEQPAGICHQGENHVKLVFDIPEHQKNTNQKEEQLLSVSENKKSTANIKPHLAERPIS